MDRLSCRARARHAASVGAVLVLVAGASGAYAGAILFRVAAELPTITFTASGPAPVLCASHPDIPSLTIRHGARIVLANFTGVDATVDTGRQNALAVEAGKAVSVRLKRGQHTLRMIPKCLVVGEAQAAVVSVLSASEMPDATATTTPPVAASEEPSVGSASTGGPSPLGREPGALATSVPAGPSAPAVHAGSAGSPGSAGSAGSVGSIGSIGSIEASEADTVSEDVLDLQEASTADIYDVRPFLVVQPSEMEGARLLAVIAAICVLGVTSAIIRAILAQRASGAVRT